jgi:lipopolysaccharide transport system permease protein
VRFPPYPRVNTTNTPDILITPRRLTSLAEWRELWAARDLLGFLIRRDLKTRYSQSVLGFGWAIVQPLFTMVVLTFFFGNLAQLSSDGVPYAVWSLTAIVPYTFFQAAVNEAGNCLAANIGVITKVYFPRLILPLAAVGGKLCDLVIMLGLLAVMLLATHQHPVLAAWWSVPIALAVALIAALAGGLWLAALAVQYRDVRVAQGLLLQLLMYGSPIIYSSSKIPATKVLHLAAFGWNIGDVTVPLRALYFCNPLAGVIEAMRNSLLGLGPTPWAHLALGAVVSLLGLVSGVWCFRRAEHVVADVA